VSLIYSMLLSRDGNVANEDEVVRSYIQQLASSVGSYPLRTEEVGDAMVHGEALQAVPKEPHFGPLRGLRSNGPENFLGVLSNSGPAVRRYSEGGVQARQMKQNETGLRGTQS
jgi:hypothetical protein